MSLWGTRTNSYRYIIIKRHFHHFDIWIEWNRQWFEIFLLNLWFMYLFKNANLWVFIFFRIKWCCISQMLHKWVYRKTLNWWFFLHHRPTKINRVWTVWPVPSIIFFNKRTKQKREIEKCLSIAQQLWDKTICYR